MRKMKLALITTIVVLLGSASAYAVTIKKRIEAPGLPPQIWEHAGGFCAIKTWHPAVAQCLEEKDGDTVFRTLTLKDGGKIREKLTGTEDHSYTYEIVESPLPVKNYRAKLWVEVDDEPDRSVIYWQADFDSEGARTRQRRRSPQSLVMASKALRSKPLQLSTQERRRLEKRPLPVTKTTTTTIKFPIVTHLSACGPDRLR